MRLDGEVLTGTLGADADWGRVLAGVAVRLSEGDGTFDAPGVDKGALERTTTTESPYARWRVSERIIAWGLAGGGRGDMTIRFDGGTDPLWTDLLMHLGALGARGVLMEQDEAGGIDLALKPDALFVRMESEEAVSSAATTADASRLRLVLEGGRAYALSDTASVRPSLELGLRHDGGAAETGAGLERGGGVTFTDATSGFSLEAKARMLAAHADTDSEEWGMSATARLDPGERRRGLSLTPPSAPLRARPSGSGAPSARRRSHRAPGSRRRGASRPRRATGCRSPADASPARPTSASGLAMAERATGASAARDRRYPPHRPPGRRADTVVVQPLGDLAHREVLADIVVEDAPHDDGFGLEDFQMCGSVADTGDTPVTVRRLPGDDFARTRTP